jgi:5-deoxy-glucuronate isomerase
VRGPVTAGDQTELVGLSEVVLGRGGTWQQVSSASETAVVVMTGSVDVEVDGRDLGVAGGRRDVFEGAGHAIYAPAGSDARLVARAAPTQLCIASAEPGGGEPAPARVIHPDEQRISVVGEGNWARTVRTILGPEHAASRLLVGETLNPPGNWSSYPPHKHDVESPPDEVRLEEVYLFKLKPSGGFGVQVRYDDDGRQEAFVVRDGDVAVIREGYHPVVAAPGYELYYLWVMAGEGRAMVPHLDPSHSWLVDE